MDKKTLFYCFLVGIISLFNVAELRAQVLDSLNITKPHCDDSINIMNSLKLNEITWVKVSEYYVPIDSTGSGHWIRKTENYGSIESIQQILYKIPNKGNVWKEWDCSEMVSLEIVDRNRNKHILYFHCGVLSSPCNGTFYSPSPLLQAELYNGIKPLFNLVQSLLKN